MACRVGASTLKNLVGLNRKELQDLATNTLGWKSYRGNQLHDWFGFVFILFFVCFLFFVFCFLFFVFCFLFFVYFFSCFLLLKQGHEKRY